MRRGSKLRSTRGFAPGYGQLELAFKRAWFRQRWLPRALWGHDVVEALYVGFCPSGADFPPKEMAHAHVYGKYAGSICIAPGQKATDLLLLHELAHLYTKSGHTKRWRQRFLELAVNHSPEMAAAATSEVEGLYTSHPQRLEWRLR